MMGTNINSNHISLFPESSVTISPDNFVPSSAQSYVTVRLDSSCAEKQSSLDLISCEKAHTQARRSMFSKQELPLLSQEEFDFTAEIELSPDICSDTSTRTSFSFDLRVLGQRGSTLTLQIGDNI